MKENPMYWWVLGMVGLFQLLTLVPQQDGAIALIGLFAVGFSLNNLTRSRSL